MNQLVNFFLSYKLNNNFFLKNIIRLEFFFQMFFGVEFQKPIKNRWYHF